MPSLSSLFRQLKTAWPGPVAPLDTAALWRDGAYFWSMMDAQPDAVREAAYARYDLVPRSYTDHYLDQIVTVHRPNPMAPLYIESELGAPARQVALLAELESAGVSVRGRRCLDIGCSNGSLLLAARSRGATACVGVDVSEGRIAAARQLCAGSDIDLRVHDLSAADLPGGAGPFDVIFCTDVLEHVGSIPGMLAAMKRHLAPEVGATVFVTVFNHLNTGCVEAEPHYGVPGMVLLPAGDAERIWMSVRDQLQSALDYEVGTWPEYDALVRDAEAVGLRITPHIDAGAVLGSRATFWRDYDTRLQELQRATTAKLGELRMSAADRELLRQAIERYSRESQARHRAFEDGLAAQSDDEVMAFYLRYYAQPIRALLRHA